MVVFLKGMKSKYVLTFDLEHDSGVIIQFAGILLERVSVDEDLYQVKSNLNTYIKKDRICKPVESLTNLTTEFINENGVSKDKFKRQFDNFLSGILPKELVCISYGVTQDSKVLVDSGIDFNKYEHLCEYRMAKRILERCSNLKLENVAEEAGFKCVQMHNAYFDAIATMWVLSYLLKIE